MTRPRRLVGLMSGTSCDGIDAAAVELSGGYGRDEWLDVEVVVHRHAPFDDALRARLLAAGDARAAELARLDAELGRLFGAAARDTLGAVGWTSAEVAVVSLSGFTASHEPPSDAGPGATLVLGNPDVAAEGCGCPVLSDLRARDRACGGHGAPLVPFADACLLRRQGRVRAALNLGGIANVTIVPPEGDPSAFDTGPGNMALDGAMRRLSGGALGFDAGGALAARGRVARDWLTRALAADDFLLRPPPRSTGRERYGDAFLDAHWSALAALPPEDVLASLAAYTVEAVALSLERFVPTRPDDLVVSGGGARNRALIDGLRRRLAPTHVLDSTDALGIPVDAREAVSWAVLADATLAGVPASVPGVTGARRAALLGRLSPAPDGRGLPRR